MLTEKQKNNIYKLPDEDLVEILDICKEKLGIVLPNEYIKITAYRKTREWLQQECKSGKKKSFKIGNKHFPFVNY